MGSGRSGGSPARDALYPIEILKTLPLQRVAQAVEAGQTSADILADFRAEYEASRAKRPEESHAEAMRDIVVELHMSVENFEAGLAALEAEPRVIRELVMRRVAEAWLEGQRGAHQIRVNR